MSAQAQFPAGSTDFPTTGAVSGQLGGQPREVVGEAVDGRQRLGVPIYGARLAGERCGSTLVAFAGGVYLFKEPNGLRKLPAVIGVLVGIVLTVLG